MEPLPEMRVDCSIFRIGRKHLLPPNFDELVEAAYKDANLTNPDRV